MQSLIDLPPPTAEEVVETPSSAAEEMALRTGRSLKDKKTDKEIQRIVNEGKIQNHLHNMIVIGIYSAGVAALAMFFCIIWHLVTPIRFLPDENLIQIKQLLFSGAVGAAISSLAKKHMGMGEA